MKTLREVLVELCATIQGVNSFIPNERGNREIDQAIKEIQEMFPKEQFRDECDKLETPFQRGRNQAIAEMKERLK